MNDRLRELAQHLRFEADHPRARRTPLGLAKKLLLLGPQAVMFLLFNFGSSFRRASATTTAIEPQDPAIVPNLDVNFRELERGLPLSDSVVRAATFDTYESVADPIFAMTELHRVLTSDARLTLRLAGRFITPWQKRIATPEALEPFASGASGVERLFEIVSSSEHEIVFQPLKRLAQSPTPRRIDLGCGPSKRAGFVGIDNRPLPGVDIVRDIEQQGLPFSDSTITHVYASHFLEHVRDLVRVMNEIHRVCCAGAEAEFIVPTLLGPWAAADPTHVRLFNARTFEYFTRARTEADETYGGVAGLYEIIEQRVSTSLYVRLRVDKTTTAAQA